jgi:hypothetical protein
MGNINDSCLKGDGFYSRIKYGFFKAEILIKQINLVKEAKPVSLSRKRAALLQVADIVLLALPFERSHYKNI